MNYDRRLRAPTYDVVLALLSEDELASVNTGKMAMHLSDADEYLDLEQIELGVRRGPGPPRPICRLLPKKAVQEATWENILAWLGEMKARTLRRRVARFPRGARRTEPRLVSGA
jgi:hypothetical protein